MDEITHRNNMSVDAGLRPAVARPSSYASADHAKQVLADDAALATQRSLYAKYGEVFTNSSTQITISSESVQGDSATVTVNELTTMTRTPDAHGQARPNYAYEWPQTVTLTRASDGWKTSSVASLVAATDEPETRVPTPELLTEWKDPATVARMTEAIQHGIPRDSQKVPDSALEQNSESQPEERAAVNLQSVVTYASRYWQQANPDYVPQKDDDCTDFASQALFAAGWPMVHTGNYNDPSQWWYDNGGGVRPQQQSWPWINAQMLSDFGGRYTRRMYADPFTPQWKASDIAFWIWDGNTVEKYDHTTIVTFVDSSGSPYFTQHSPGHYNQSYAAYIAAKPHAYVADMHLRTTA